MESNGIRQKSADSQQPPQKNLTSDEESKDVVEKDPYEENDISQYIKALQEDIIPINTKTLSYKEVMLKSQVYGPLEQSITVKDFLKNAQNLINQAPSEFRNIEKITCTQAHIESLDQQEKNMDLNRYIDILPFISTKVRLEYSNEYINANFVDGPLQSHQNKYIATQGPKDNTVIDFWLMVHQQNVKIILATCKLSEGGRTKCAHYWPKKGADPIRARDDNVTIIIECTDETQLSTYLYLRTFKVIVNKLEKTVEQYHYVGWPDHDVPTGKSMNEFKVMLERFVQWTLKSANDERAIIHCSAGIGRTGTTIALTHLMIKIMQQIVKGTHIDEVRFSIFSTVRSIREQRYSLVQMANQYGFIYQYLALWLGNECYKEFIGSDINKYQS
eukprot:403345347